jgi:hypothetical protein
MPSVSLEDINTAIADTMREITGVVVQDFDELTEGINDWPLIQVYWERYVPDRRADNNERSTFGAGVRVSQATFHIDVFAKPRAHIGEDVTKLLTVMGWVIDKLNEQQRAPYFGLSGIKGYAWNAERVTFQYAQQQFSGGRVVLDVAVY